jgi:hypothetical protein
MKTVAIALMLVLAVSAAGTAEKSKAESMTEMAARAADAVDAALQVLLDLRQANIDAQDAADASNKTQQVACDNEIADLHSIADTNKETGDASTAHRKFLEQEIVDTTAYLEWIINRRVEIHDRQIELQDQRCYGSGIFVRALKEHSDTIHAVELLRQDVLPAADASTPELAQVKSAASKLTAYKHLFDEQALAAFNQLADDVDAATAEWDTDADDNEVGRIQLLKWEGNDRNLVGGGLTQQILDLLDKLEENERNSIKELEAGEIEAAWNLAVWLQDSEAELIHLDDEEERKTVYLDKIKIAVQAARAQENKAWEIYFQSATAYNNAVKECIRKGEVYVEEKHQREDETALLDEVIKTFKESVLNISGDVRSNSITRRTNTNDLGNFQNVVERSL